MECKRIECSLGANKVSTPHLNEACKRPLLPLVSLEIEAAQRQDATWLKTLKPVLQSNCASPLCFRHIKCDQIFPHRTNSAAMIANVFCTLQMWTNHRGVNNWTSLSLLRLGQLLDKKTKSLMKYLQMSPSFKSFAFVVRKDKSWVDR